MTGYVQMEAAGNGTLSRSDPSGHIPRHQTRYNKIVGTNKVLPVSLSGLSLLGGDLQSLTNHSWVI